MWFTYSIYFYFLTNSSPTLYYFSYFRDLAFLAIFMPWYFPVGVYLLYTLFFLLYSCTPLLPHSRSSFTQCYVCPSIYILPAYLHLHIKFLTVFLPFLNLSFIPAPSYFLFVLNNFCLSSCRNGIHSLMKREPCTTQVVVFCCVKYIQPSQFAGVICHHSRRSDDGKTKLICVKLTYCE